MNVLCPGSCDRAVDEDMSYERMIDNHSPYISLPFIRRRKKLMELLEDFHKILQSVCEGLCYCYWTWPISLDGFNPSEKYESQLGWWFHIFSIYFPYICSINHRYPTKIFQESVCLQFFANSASASTKTVITWFPSRDVTNGNGLYTTFNGKTHHF